MDHRCLYGHRVPSSFDHAIRSRACPTCGAATVSIVGYQAAQKLSRDGGMEALTAFNAIRLIEAEWVIVPAEPEEEGTEVGAKEASASLPALEEVAVVDTETPSSPKIRPVSRPRPRAPEPLAPAEAAFFKED
jgi:hypothetical protein